MQRKTRIKIKVDIINKDNTNIKKNNRIILDFEYDSNNI